MDKETMNKYQMARSTQNYLDTNNATWSAIPIANTFKTELDDQLLGVGEQLKGTGVSTKGITIGKNDLKKQISIKTVVLSGALSAYATASKNPDLLSNGSFAKSDVTSMRDIELPGRLTGFTDLLTAHLKPLVPYGVSRPQVTDLLTSVDDFREQVGQPRLIQSKANVAKKAAETLVENALEILNDKMDNVMLQFKFSNPSFYEGYKRARVIVD
jgi:hypothetical protein